jgi:RimJ/RimL family protein N-acetyltransferase
MMEVLETDRLLMRPFERDDRDALVELHREESFWWYPLRRGMSRAETAGFLDRVLSAYDSDEVSLHALVVRSTGSFIGWAGLSNPTFLPEVLPAIEVGWRLATAARGWGYATEAGAAAIRWGFDSLGLTEILSILEPDNLASGGVMDQLGFGPGFTTTHPTEGMPLLVRTLTEEQWRAAS